MILLINVCKEKLHYFEFVKPIEDIVKSGKECLTKNYNEINQEDIDNADKIIICGTSLKDNEYLKDTEKFSWIRETKKPILGICAGMQIICAIFECELEKNFEIGMRHISFQKSFLGLGGKKEVYGLHNLGVRYDSKLRENFNIFAKPKSVQAIKHIKKEIYGVLFHPEVRNKGLISNFINIGL